MFRVDDDLSIYATRGDTVFFTVSANDNGTPYYFEAGDVLRMKIFGKKDAENVVMEKEFPVTAKTDQFVILLTEEDTKFGEVISKPTTYWYEIELNPYTNPQTIIGYDDDGPKLFVLYPEGADSEIPETDPEVVAVIDDELDMTSPRPVRNRAIASAIVNIQAACKVTEEAVKEQTATATAELGQMKAELATERSRIDNFVALKEGSTTGDAELMDARIDINGVAHESAGRHIRSHLQYLAKMITGFTYTDNVFLNNSGKTQEHELYKVSDYVDISAYAGETLLLYSSVHMDAGFAFYDKDKNCIAGVDGYDSGYVDTELNGYFRLTLPLTAHYLRFTLRKDEIEDGKVVIYPGYTGVKLLQDQIDNLDHTDIALDDVAYTELSCIAGANGNVVVSDNSGFPLASSGFVNISGHGLKDLYLTAFFQNYAGMAFYDEEKNYIVGHSGTSLGIAEYFHGEVVLKTPANAHYIRFTHHNGFDSYRVRFKDNTANIVEAISNGEVRAENVFEPEYGYAAENVLCIGDSLTSGANYVSAEYNGKSVKQNYPYYLGRMLNCDVTNAGVSGWSASDWYRDFKDSYNYADYDTFIIWLGTNYGCGEMPTDDAISAFVPDDSVSASEADQALYLIKIITDIQTANPDAFIVLCNVFTTKADKAANNATITEIAEKYGLIELDMSDLNNASYPELHGGISNVHFGKAGNIYIASRIKHRILSYITENPLRAEFGYSPRP